MSASRHTYVVVLVKDVPSIDLKDAEILCMFDNGDFATGSKKAAEEQRDSIASRFPKETYEVKQLR